MISKNLFLAATAPMALLIGSTASANEISKGVYVYGAVGGSSIANQAVKDKN